MSSRRCPEPMSLACRAALGRCVLPLLALVLFLASGCASHRANLERVTSALRAGDPNVALQEFEKRGSKERDLLYQLEHGHLLHLAGRWAESNAAFEQAEQLADELYTKSVSREVAALLTTDLANPYRGMPYELQLIQYYRALNYLALDKESDALVEARKANFELTQYAEATENDPAFRQDAFLQYFTGLLYAARGDWNDAIVSLRSAHELYQRYAEEYGIAPPVSLEADYIRAAKRVGLDEEVRPIVDARRADGAEEGDAADENLVVFLESGFAPFRESVDIMLPIFEQHDRVDPWDSAALYRDRYGSRIYDYRASARELSHVLRFAFPRLVEVPPLVRSGELEWPAGGTAEAEPALDLAKVAQAEFNDRLPAILLRTAARAIAKEAARRGAATESEGLGIVVNLLGAASEQADTRGWVLLPGRIDLIKATLPPGRQSVVVRFLGGGGGTVEEHSLEVDIPEHGVTFASVRCFQ